MALALCAAIAVATTQSACGNSQQRTPDAHRASSPTGFEPPQSQHPELEQSSARQVVATVGTRTVTLGFLEMWTSLWALLGSSYKTSTSVPTGFVPDPPAYRRCIAYLAGAIHAPKTVGQSRREQLESQCEVEHGKQLESSLARLVIYLWIYQEAAKHHLQISAAEAEQRAASSGVKQGALTALGVPPSVHQFLAGDELRLAKLLTTVPAYRTMIRLGHESPQLTNELDNQDGALYLAMKQRGVAHTHCQPEYVVPGCGNYEAGATP